MATFADLTARLNLNIANFSNNMQKAAAQANKFAAGLQGQINTGLVTPAKKAKFEFKDVARIVQGILISKAFYSGLNAIRNATNAVWEFSQQLEYAQMVYTNLFDSSELASEFINVLQDFAAVTPFTFRQSEEAAKRLLAYGIEYQNVMYVMQGVLAASTVQQNPQAIESISRALGQIYTKGRLMGEEMRQLADAGIPAYEILQEKLGLTSDELRNLGKHAVPANVAINALVDGLQERFGSTLAQSAKTTQGVINNLKDNAEMLFSGIFEPAIRAIREQIGKLGETIATLRNVFDAKGVGGVFEAIFPPSMHASIRAFIANLSNLWNIVKTNLVSVFTVFRHVVQALLRVFNAFAPVINIVLALFTGLGKMIADNEKLMKILMGAVIGAATAWLIYKAQALGAAITTAVIKGLIVAVKGLVTALNFLAMHPVWALLALGVGLFAALSGASNSFANSIRKLFSGLTSLGKVNPDNILLPESKERANDLNKFNKRLGETSGAMDDLADKTGKATKAAKGLLGFDEVFSIKTPDADAGSGITDSLDGLIDGLSGLGATDIWGDLDFGDVAQGFVDNLLDALGGKEKVMNAGIGAIIGAAIGGILGGSLGAKIGAVAGTIAGWFWDDVAKALGLSDSMKIATPIAALLGVAVGKVFGVKAGLITAGIALLVAGLIDGIKKGIETGDWTGVPLPLGTLLGAAIGLAFGHPLIGAAIGAGVGLLVKMIMESIETGDWTMTTLALGTSIGAVIGLAFGHPIIGAAIGAGVGLLINMVKESIDTGDWSLTTTAMGTAIGGAIGMLVGNPIIGAAIGTVVGYITSKVIEGFQEADAPKAAGSIGVLIGGLVGLLFGPVGAAIGAAVGGLVAWVTALIVDNWDSIAEWFANLGRAIDEWFVWLFVTIIEGLKNACESVSTWFTEMRTLIEEKMYEIWVSVSDWFSEVWTTVEEKLSEVWESVSTWFSETWAVVDEKMYEIWVSVSDWFSEVWTIAEEKLSEIWESVSNWFSEIWSVVYDKLSETWESVSEWFQSIWDTISEKLSGAWNATVEWLTNIWTTIVEKLTKAWNSVSEWFQNIWDTIIEKLSGAWHSTVEWFQNMWNTVVEKLSGAWGAVSEWFQSMWDTITEKLSGAWESVKTFFTNMYDTMKTKISDMFTGVKEGLGNIYTSFKNWISDMWSNIFGKLFGWIDTGISKFKEFFGFESKAASIEGSKVALTKVKTGHATGGIFNREHVANFAEGNKAEAIIPLENNSAMQPFVDAVANGITQSLMPILANMNNNANQANPEDLRPLLVNTLIADDRGLKELERRMRIIQVNENQRRGVR